MDILIDGYVHNYFIFSLNDLKKLKSNMTQEDLAYFKELTVSCISDYEELKNSVIYTKGNLDEVDLNDYVCLSPYWWPDKSKKNGLPYIRFDGEVNPESNMYDKLNFYKLGHDIYFLCLLYYFTNDINYYNILKKNVYYYLLDSITGMNPNLEHGQMVRGQDLGKPSGIIEYSAGIAFSFHLFNLIYEEGLIEQGFKDDLNKWIKEFLGWMTTSQMALKERDGNNNHAIYYDFGVAVLYDFLQDDSKFSEIIDRSINLRIKKQIASDGSMSEELARTKSKHYSIMALKGILNLHNVSVKYGYSLWENLECKTILTKAINYLYDGLLYKKFEWKYIQIDHVDSAFFLSIMKDATKYIDSSYNDIDLISKEDVDNKVAYFLGSKLL